MSGLPDPEDLVAFSDMALELARLAGTEMQAALGQDIAIRYKQGDDRVQSLKDPVSEVDQAVELIIRARLAERFPGHDVLGEEMAERPARGSRFLWAVDPVDGTANFINGFPMFAGSIGLLLDGVPIAGAVWCASSHALRAGVYHTGPAGDLRFEGEPLRPRHNPEVKRRLGGFPDASPRSPAAWEARRTGSAAIECAFVAAGLLDVAQFDRPNVWDVAGGFALVRAAGGEIRYQGPEGWMDFKGFAPDSGGGDPAAWRRPVVLGRRDAVEALCRLGAG
jgi:myo-inositol-1(or 4)-monophosphatase